MQTVRMAGAAGGKTVMEEKTTPAAVMSAMVPVMRAAVTGRTAQEVGSMTTTVGKSTSRKTAVVMAIEGDVVTQMVEAETAGTRAVTAMAKAVGEAATTATCAVATVAAARTGAVQMAPARETLVPELSAVGTGPSEAGTAERREGAGEAKEGEEVERRGGRMTGEEDGRRRSRGGEGGGDGEEEERRGRSREGGGREEDRQARDATAVPLP